MFTLLWRIDEIQHEGSVVYRFSGSACGVGSVLRLSGDAMSDDLQGLLSLVALAIVFFALIPHDTKMKIGETVLHERKQPSAPQKKVDDENTVYIKYMSAYSHHIVWYDALDNKHWANTVIDMNGDEIIVHNSDGTGYLDE